MHFKTLAHHSQPLLKWTPSHLGEFLLQCSFPKNPSGCAHRILLPLRIDFPTAPPKTTAQQKNSPKKWVVCHILGCTTKYLPKNPSFFHPHKKQQPVNRKPTKEPFLTPLISEVLAPALGGDLWSGHQQMELKVVPHNPRTPPPKKKTRFSPPKKLVCIIWSWKKNNNYPIFKVVKFKIYDKFCLQIFWLVVSAQLKNISQNGNLPQIGVKITNIWNHHPDIYSKFCLQIFFSPNRQLSPKKNAPANISSASPPGVSSPKPRESLSTQKSGRPEMLPGKRLRWFPIP